MTADDLTVLAYALLEDAEIYAATDGEVLVGPVADPLDSRLQSGQKTCLVIRALNENVSGTPGGRFHGRAEFDRLIDIAIITKRSDAYGRQVASLVRNKLVQDLQITYDGAQHLIRVKGLSFGPTVYDPDGLSWTIPVTVRSVGWY